MFHLFLVIAAGVLVGNLLTGTAIMGGAWGIWKSRDLRVLPGTSSKGGG